MSYSPPLAIISIVAAMAFGISAFENSFLLRGAVSRSLNKIDRPIKPFVAFSKSTRLSNVMGVVNPISDKNGRSSPLSNPAN